MKKRITAVIILFAVIFTQLPQAGITVSADPGRTYQTRMVVQGNNTDFRANSGIVFNTAESEHFQLIWGGATPPNGHSLGTTTTSEGYVIHRRAATTTSTVGTQSNQVTDTFIRRTLANLEVCYDILIRDYEFTPPSQNINNNHNPNGTHYKINLVIQNTGILGHDNPDQGWGAYAGIDNQGFAFMMMVPAALGAASNVISHEFGHCVVFAQRGWRTNDRVGPWHEAMANYIREIVMQSPRWAAAWTSMGGTGTPVTTGDDIIQYMRNLTFTPATPRGYYQAWPFLVYLTQNPDNINGLGSNAISRILRESNNHEHFHATLNRIFPNANIKDTLGHYAKRLATFDLGGPANNYFQRNITTPIANNGYWNEVYTVPEPTGKPNTFAVPTSQAPQAAGINIIPLQGYGGTGSNISVTLNGLTSLNSADWRFAIVARTSGGASHYSNLASPGQTAMLTLPANTSQVFVTVTATPSVSTLATGAMGNDFIGMGFPNSTAGAGNFREANRNFNQKPRYPYEITITGAERMVRRSFTLPTTVHPNGGGRIESASRVDATAYVGPNAVVRGNAQVRGNAVIDGYAVIEGNAIVRGNAKVDGYANVLGNAIVEGNAHVSDQAVVRGGAQVLDNAKVLGNAHLFENNVRIRDNSIAQGVAYIHGSVNMTGQAIADGDYFNHENTWSAGTIAGYIPQGQGATWDSLVNSKSHTDGMHHGYSFSASTVTSSIVDRYHSTYASPYGSPIIENSRTSASGVLTLNGSNQYVNVSRNLAMFRDFEIQTAVLWRGGNPNQKIFHFGDNADYMYLTPRNADGRAEFVIKVGNTTQRLTASAPLPVGRWTIVTVRKAGNNGTLTFNVGGTINGNVPTPIPTVTSSSLSLNPVQVSGKLTNDAVYSLGRDTTGNYFNGSYDYFDVFFKAAPAPAYTYTEIESSVEVTTTPQTTSAPPTTTTVATTTTTVVPRQPLNGVLIKSLTVNESIGNTDYSAWSIEYNLQTQDRVYGDRDNVFINIPVSLRGSERIRLSVNGSRQIQGNVAEFTAGENITVFVGLDSRVNSGIFPEWLNNWTQTDTVITASDQTNPEQVITYNLYSRNFSKDEKVTLGSNTSTGTTSGVLMYTVFAVSREPLNCKGDRLRIDVVDFEDDYWITIENITANENISTRGLYLSENSDNEEELLKRQMPVIIIRTGEIIRVSGKNIAPVWKRGQVDFDIGEAECLRLVDAGKNSVACWNMGRGCLCG